MADQRKSADIDEGRNRRVDEEDRVRGIAEGEDEFDEGDEEDLDEEDEDEDATF